MRRLRWKEQSHNVYVARDRQYEFDRDTFTVACAGVGQWLLTIDHARRQNFGLPDAHHVSTMPTDYGSRTDAQQDAEHYRRFWED